MLESKVMEIRLFNLLDPQLRVLLIEDLVSLLDDHPQRVHFVVQTPRLVQLRASNLQRAVQLFFLGLQISDFLVIYSIERRQIRVSRVCC